jgi:uncharacterized iron-regulated protein
MRVLVLMMMCCMSFQAQCVEHIYHTATQTSINQQQLVEQLKQHSLILLGEVHDEPLHHLRRAELIQALSAQHPMVVAEQLETGKQVQYSAHLAEDLAQAGFDAKVWDWDVYAPLFSILATEQIPLVGGNLPLDTVRRIAKQGEVALPDALAARIQAAPLSEGAKLTLEADLENSHCGHLPKAMLPNFILAQRARDASMLNSMQQAKQTPVVLLAGNGHVRKDYGIPTLLSSGQPSAVSVGFLQADTLTPEVIQTYQAQYDYVWLTGAVEAEDACAAFKLKK